MNALHSDQQPALFGAEENRAYLTEQLITYIGNKRALLDFIGPVVDKVKGKLGKERIRTLDLFSGSGIVARYLKRHSELLIANDLEDYCEVINRCYLANPAPLDLPSLRETHQIILHRLKTEPLREGIIARNYAPKDDNSIEHGERAFYTNRNARYLDTARELIAGLPDSTQPFFLGPLLSQASIHANTSGVFKGFYKNSGTGVGRFGGTNGDALFRIKGDMVLPFPVFSFFECQVQVCKKNANNLVRQLEHVDLAYLDPPYNQHPYGSNYFMLNLLINYQEPQQVSRVSGIPRDWKRSGYNKRQKAFQAFSDLVKNLDAQFMLVSFNSEGFIRKDDMLQLLSTVGQVELLETKYNAFRGSRNLRTRDIHVKEYLYLVERFK